MKASELIAEIQKAIEEHGDVDIDVMDSDYYSYTELSVTYFPKDNVITIKGGGYGK